MISNFSAQYSIEKKKHPAYVDIVFDAFQVKILKSNQEDISTPITQNDTCI